jgi:hypothetical protein
MNADVFVCFQRYRVDRHTSVVYMQVEAIFGTTLVSNGIMAVSVLYTIYLNQRMLKTVNELKEKVDRLDKKVDQLFDRLDKKVDQLDKTTIKKKLLVLQ